MFNWLNKNKQENVSIQQDAKVVGNDYIKKAASEIATAYFNYVEEIDIDEIYSELDTMEENLPELEAALDTIADTTTQGEKGDEFTFKIQSPNTNLQTELNGLYNRMNLHDEIWGIARDMVKYGNEFDLIQVQDGSIVELETLPVYVMRRKYLSGLNHPNDMFYRVAYDSPDTIEQEYAYDDVIHWRWKIPRSGFMRDSTYYPPLYGRGLGFSFLKTYKKLLLMEDSLVLGRLTRAIAKIVYKLDVGNLSPAQAEKLMKDRKAELGRKKYIDASTGRLSDTTNPLQDEDDIFIETRTGSESDVKALNLQQAAQFIGDVSYIQNKLFCALRTPKGYLNYEKDLNARATLLKQDVQFGRWIKRLQSALTYGIKDLGYRQLALSKGTYGANALALQKQAQFLLRDTYTLPELTNLLSVHSTLKDNTFLAQTIYKDSKLGDNSIEKVVLLLNGATEFNEMKSNTAPFDILFPAVSTDDELTKAQIDSTKSKVAIALSAIGLMGRKDILVTVFDYTEEEADVLVTAANEDLKGMQPSKQNTVKDAANAVFNSVMSDLTTIALQDEKFLRDKHTNNNVTPS